MASINSKAIARSDSRLVWIDAAKALGIILVVVGHNPYIIHQQHTLHNLIFTFHVPLFFALSGATLRSTYAFRQVAVRMMSLIWVFFAVTLLSIPLVLLRFQHAHHDLTDLLLGIIYGTSHTLHPVPMWFLTSLALVLPVTWLFLKLVDGALGHGNQHSYLAMLVLGIFLCFGNGLWLASQNFQTSEHLAWGNLWQSGAIWNLDLLGLGVGYALIGHGLATWLNKPSLTMSRVALSATVLITVFIVLFIGTQPQVNLAERLFTPTWAALVVSISGVAASLIFCRLLQTPWPIISKIGMATLPILAMHQLLQKKTLAFMGEPEGGYALVAFVVSVLIAITVSVISDTKIFRNTRLGQLIFYPRSALLNKPT